MSTPQSIGSWSSRRHRPKRCRAPLRTSRLERDWRVEKDGAGQGNAQHLSVDLFDPEDCTAKLSELHDITHLIFAAYAERPTPADLVKVNVALPAKSP